MRQRVFRFSVGLQLDLPRLTIGEDVIRRLHVYIAYKEKVMYVTSATAH